MIKTVFVLLMVLVGLTFGYATPMTMSMSQTPLNQLKNQEEVLFEVEKMFIYETFTKPLMEAENVFRDDEDNEFAAEQEYFDQLFAQKIAEVLAKKDILGFKK